MSVMSVPILQVADLSVDFFTWQGVFRAVSDVSFNLCSGETLAIVGESGCGKSVTSKSLMRLLPKSAKIAAGSSIKFQGDDLSNASVKKMRSIRGKSISMVFQDPMSFLNPTMTIGDQIIEVLEAHTDLPKSKLRQEAVEWLARVNIPDPEVRLKSYPHQFSGGMRQRAIIAMALACRPKVLIADEPTTALDVTIQADIMDLISSLQKEMGTAVILVTHDLGIAAGFANRVQVMYAGSIVETGVTDDVFYRALHPYTQALINSVPRLDTPRKEPLISLKGTPPDLFKLPSGCPFAPRCVKAMKICARLTPPSIELSKGHTVSCWLHHPTVKKSLGVLR